MATDEHPVAPGGPERPPDRPPGAPGGPRGPLTQTLVDGHLLDVWLDDSGPVVVLPGIAAGFDARALPAIPDRAVPFGNGIVTPLTIVIREENRVQPEPDGGGVGVRSLCSWLVTANGVPIYGRSWAPHAGATLSEIGWKLDGLRLHPVQWWREADWRDRAVWFEGVPARVRGFDGRAGRAWLEAEPGFSFSCDPATLEGDDAAAVQAGRARVEVDILDPGVAWVRNRSVATNASSARNNQNEQSTGEIGRPPPPSDANLEAADMET